MTNYWNQAQEARKSAQLLVEKGYPRGAINRAYYAVFHAARAVLCTIDVELVQTRRHSTIIGRFGRDAVKARGLDTSLTRTMHVLLDVRIVADYEVTELTNLDAQDVLRQARGSWIWSLR